MDVVEESLDLVELAAIGAENLRRAREVVNDGDREDFNAHLLLYFTACAFILVCFLELGYRVVIFICELPPFRAELAHVVERVFLEALREGCKFFIDLDQVLQIKLYVFI